MLLLIDKLEMQFANLNNDPRDIWGIELPEHVPTIMIIKDNQIVMGYPALPIKDFLKRNKDE